MEEITAEQFLEGAKDWRPSPGLLEDLGKALRASQAPEATVLPLSQAFRDCAQGTYDYIQYIHQLATAPTLGKADLLPQVTQLVGLVRKLQDSARQYRSAFQDYDQLTRSGLTRDRFDTVYYDAIQNLELRVVLKRIIDDVEALLQSFSLVSEDLTGTRCVDLYEGSIRFQLFLQYFLNQDKFDKEELWSVLFDVFNQVGEMVEFPSEPTPEDLKDLQEKIEKFRTN